MGEVTEMNEDRLISVIDFTERMSLDIPAVTSIHFDGRDYRMVLFIAFRDGRIIIKDLFEEMINSRHTDWKERLRFQLGLCA